jgi:WD40 repeat protein
MSDFQLLRVISDEDYVMSVAFSPNGLKIAFGSADGTVSIWNANARKDNWTLDEQTRGSVSSVAFSPDGRQIVSGSADGTVRIGYASKNGGKDKWTLNEQTGSVNSVAFSPDGSKIVSGSADGMVKIRDSNSGALERTLVGHSDSVNSVAFSLPDGSKIVSGSADGTVKIWNANTGDVEQTLVGHSDSVNSVAFSPDGSKIASGSADETVKIWNAATGTLEHTLKHLGSVKSVCFNETGSKIVSGSSSYEDKCGITTIWNVLNGKIEHTIEEDGSEEVVSVAFSPIDATIASATGKTVSLRRDNSTKKALKEATVAMLAIPRFRDPGIEAKIAEFNAPNNPEDLNKHVREFHLDNVTHQKRHKLMQSIKKLKKGGLSKSKRSKTKKSKSKSKSN